MLTFNPNLPTPDDDNSTDSDPAPRATGSPASGRQPVSSPPSPPPSPSPDPLPPWFAETGSIDPPQNLLPPPKKRPPHPRLRQLSEDIVVSGLLMLQKQIDDEELSPQARRLAATAAFSIAGRLLPRFKDDDDENGEFKPFPPQYGPDAPKLNDPTHPFSHHMNQCYWAGWWDRDANRKANAPMGHDYKPNFYNCSPLPSGFPSMGGTGLRPVTPSLLVPQPPVPPVAVASADTGAPRPPHFTRSPRTSARSLLNRAGCPNPPPRRWGGRRQGVGSAFASDLPSSSSFLDRTGWGSLRPVTPPLTDWTGGTPVPPRIDLVNGMENGDLWQTFGLREQQSKALGGPLSGGVARRLRRLAPPTGS